MRTMGFGIKSQLREKEWFLEKSNQINTFKLSEIDAM